MSRRQKSRPKVEHEKKKEMPSKSEMSEEEPKTAEKKEHHFTLYDLLELKKEATSDEIKKQYRKLVLQYHPDKNQQDPQARQKFQKLKEAYDILMDSEKRKEYDETGTVGDGFNEGTFEAAYNYYRTLYKKVTTEDINDFEKKYRFGPMEEEDLINFYKEHKGNMRALVESIPLSKNEDIPRYIEFFEQAIEKKTLPHFKLFDKTKDKVREIEDQQSEFEEEQRKNMGALVAAIHGRSNKVTDFIAQMQKKYGVGSKKKAEPKPKKKKQ